MITAYVMHFYEHVRLHMHYDDFVKEYFMIESYEVTDTEAYYSDFLRLASRILPQSEASDVNDVSETNKASETSELNVLLDKLSGNISLVSKEDESSKSRSKLCFANKIFANKMGALLRDYEKARADQPRKIKKYIDDFYKSPRDFTQYRNNIIFADMRDFRLYIDIKKRNSTLEYTIKSKNDPDAHDPYIINDPRNKVYYMVQNVRDGELLRALAVCKSWYLNRINTGYETPPLLKRISHISNIFDTNGQLTGLLDTTGGDKNFVEVLYNGSINDYNSQRFNYFSALLPLF
jgi:hypothetical protein